MWPSPAVEPIPRTPLVTSVPPSVDRAAARAPEAGERLDELRLAIAVDAGDADDLAGTHVEADAAHRRETAVVVDREPLDLEQRLARTRRLPCPPAEATSRPTIMRARPCSVAPSRGTVSTSLPRRSTLIRSAISSTSCSLWLMKMTDMPSRVSVRRIAKRSIASLRRQHRRGLVEDEDVGAAVERLQDLDALLLADRDVLRRARRDRSRS